MRLSTRIRHRLLSVARRRVPDFVIGDPGNPYLRRWWVIPRNPLLNVYLHEIRRSDDDRALHDHPWINASWLLRGSYVEVLPRESGQPCAMDFARHGLRRVRRFAGQWVCRRARAAHRLEITGDPCWTLFITGPRLRTWGFRCASGWVAWQVFTAAQDGRPGQIGRGCGEGPGA